MTTDSVNLLARALEAALAVLRGEGPSPAIPGGTEVSPASVPAQPTEAPKRGRGRPPKTETATTNPTPAAPAPAPAPAVQDPMDFLNVTPTELPKEYKVEQVRMALVDYQTDSNSPDKARVLLQEVGNAPTLVSLKPEKYAAIVDAVFQRLSPEAATKLRTKLAAQ